MKACSQCGVVKPLTLFYRQSDRPDGRRSQCATCSKEYRDSVKPPPAPIPDSAITPDYSSVNTDWEFTESDKMFIAKCREPKDLTHLTTMKHCTKCGTDKPITDYWKNNTRKDGYENMCKPCKQERDTRTNHQTKNPASTN